MRGFFNRFTEPSTYAGLAVLGTLFGVKELQGFGIPEVATTFATAASAIAAMLMKEKGPK